MREKKRKSMLFLMLLLLILLAAYLGLQTWNRNQEKKQQEKKEKEIIYVTEIDEVTAIKYDVGNGEISFQKENDTWYDMQDSDFPLAQTYPQQIADTFSNLKADRELEGGDSLADYGLEEPVYTVELTDADGDKTILYYGNAVGDNYYVTLGDKGTVYTVSGASISDLQYTLADMAQLDTYPTIGSGNLKKEVIKQGDSTTTYDSENEEDAENIAAVAGGLGAVTLSEVADYSVEEKDLAGFGLDDGSRVTVEATYTQDDEETTMILYIGNTDGNGNRYVMIDDSKIVYLISEEVCNNILNQE